jgi:hypothetical protein
MVNPPIYVPEDDSDLSPRLRTLTLQIPQSVTNLSKEPLKVVVKKATVRKDLCTPKGLQVTSHHILLMVVVNCASWNSGLFSVVSHKVCCSIK